MTATVAAIDLGATSGRVVRAEVSRRSLRLEEVARFEHRPVRIGDGLHWNPYGNLRVADAAPLAALAPPAV